MKALLKTELHKALKNKYFFITLIIASVIAILGAINRINEYQIVLELVNADKAAHGGVSWRNPYLPADTLFTYWIGGECFSLYFSLYFLLIPLFAAFPYGWSYFMEYKKGYVKNVITRTSKKNYFLAKYIAVFIAGGLVVALPLLLNFLTVSCFVPARTPSVLYSAYTYVVFSQMWSALFYTHPFVYVGLYLLLNFAFGGLIACLCLAISFVIKNRVAVLVVPLFLMLCLNFANTYSKTWELSPINFLHPGVVVNPANGWIVLLEGACLFAVSFGVTMWRGQRDDVF